MGIGARYFIFDATSATHLSQRIFKDFFFGGLPALPEHAGKAINLATVFLDLENRKPKKILRLETARLQVGPDGSLEEEHFAQAMAAKLSLTRGVKTEDIRSNVVDASRAFDARRAALASPEVPQQVLHLILQATFN